MHKFTFYLSIATAAVGLLLLLPLSSVFEGAYQIVLTVHIILGLTLAYMLIRLLYHHIPSELYNPFRKGFKKWNGFKLFLYLSIGILSGSTLLFYYNKWLLYFHGFIGLWALLVGWKHRRS
jgi:hypothetical protein